MSTIQKFEEIVSWQEARILNQEMGKLIDTERFSKNFRLIAQIEGSAGSIMENIAEGFERGGNKEFLQFLYIAKGSCGELRSQLYRALDRNYIDEMEFEKYSTHTKKINFLIQKLIAYLSSSPIKGVKYKGREWQKQKQIR
ncbi:MAG: four helix bundle protein [Chitinophagaceae bacterium]|nr:MAG: four helix bundle protein [Chitinophagaceae bacterium]